ncbi:MAG: adenosylmethionine--8-amino-7-oxononanoate transaminase [Gammaproteobacteria bacterium]|nr:adenosylmethionine--8-amino-7-oxononanoate transaminase [Gammaproteobacteria bacterium]
MSSNKNPDWLEDDKKHVWHPYSAIDSGLPVFPVTSANGVRLKLSDGRELIDGMASWWCAIHGYNHPILNKAITEQLESMAHIMFGGLTHQPAVELANKLVAVTPASLQSVFFSDSGSVSVEVAMKMATQYWRTKGHNNKQKFLTVRGGYHGDTFGAMSVSDPVTGMHQLFADSIAQQFFVETPTRAFGEACTDDDMQAMKETLSEYQENIAAVILEPVVQGAGGMRFYSADYLNRLRELCDEYDVLLIFDEIATGFGRTGKLFALEHSEVVPDILCLGKSLTGGYMTLAATLTTSEVSQTISNGDPGLFMHGPTFMANPLACSVALASIELLLDSPWQENVARIEQQLKEELQACASLDSVKEVRVLGAIGVVEMKQPVDMKTLPQQFVDEGVWLRPFGKLVYLMPPYIIQPDELSVLTKAVYRVISKIEHSQ